MKIEKLKAKNSLQGKMITEEINGNSFKFLLKCNNSQVGAVIKKKK